MASKLIALVFDDPYKADEVRAALRRMGGEGLLEIDELAVIEKRTGGKVRISQDTDVTAQGQHIGHMVGIVVAAITGTMPFIFAGTVAGRLIATVRDDGITSKFIRQVKEKLEPDTSALILLGRSDAERRQHVMARLRKFDPKVLESDLPPELEQELTRSLEGKEAA
jgi:uncharacterized membrane protein